MKSVEYVPARKNLLAVREVCSDASVTGYGGYTVEHTKLHLA